MKKLRRSNTDRWAGGVLSGMGTYFNVDPIVFRLIYIVFLVVTGVFPGVIIYIAAMLIIPKEERITPSRPVDEPHVTDEFNAL
jgi:phage shock protein C